MLEYIFSIVIIALTIVFFGYVVFKPSTKSPDSNKGRPEQENNSNTEPKGTSTVIEPQSKEVLNKECIIEDTKAYLIKSIKEIQDLKWCYIYNNGHVILFSNDQQITLCYMKTPKGTKGTKCLSKKVEMDLISDISYSDDTKMIACALKNSKEVIFYKIEYDSSKNKLAKSDMVKIASDRVYEIRNVVLSKNGQYVLTSGQDKDTDVKIYSTAKGELISNIDTGGIHNLDMKITPDDNYIGIATFLNEISVIHFEKNEKFNKETLAYETTMKVARKKSVSSLKEPILAFEFSNDERFFVLTCASKEVKVFQNFGNFSESKPFGEFKIGFQPYVITLFVNDFFNGKLKGYIAIANGNDVHVYDVEGNIKQIFTKAHEDEIIRLKLVRISIDDNNNGINESIGEDDLNKISFNDSDNDAKRSIVLISASRDGRVKFWDLKLE